MRGFGMRQFVERCLACDVLGMPSTVRPHRRLCRTRNHRALAGARAHDGRLPRASRDARTAIDDERVRRNHHESRRRQGRPLVHDRQLAVDGGQAAEFSPKQCRCSCSRLVTPTCVDASGKQTGKVSDASGHCASGTPEFNSVRDIHLGIITSSLGSHGGTECAPQSDGRPPPDARRTIARSCFRPRIRPCAASIDSWNGSGFLAWDPSGTKNNAPGRGRTRPPDARLSRSGAEGGRARLRLRSLPRSLVSLLSSIPSRRAVVIVRAAERRPLRSSRSAGPGESDAPRTAQSVPAPRLAAHDRDADRRKRLLDRRRRRLTGLAREHELPAPDAARVGRVRDESGRPLLSQLRARRAERLHPERGRCRMLERRWDALPGAVQQGGRPEPALLRPKTPFRHGFAVSDAALRGRAQQAHGPQPGRQAGSEPDLRRTRRHGGAQPEASCS